MGSRSDLLAFHDGDFGDTYSRTQYATKSRKSHKGKNNYEANNNKISQGHLITISKSSNLIKKFHEIP
jgi:hypothetical protein